MNRRSFIRWACGAAVLLLPGSVLPSPGWDMDASYPPWQPTKLGDKTNSFTTETIDAMLQRIYRQPLMDHVSRSSRALDGLAEWHTPPRYIDAVHYFEIG